MNPIITWWQGRNADEKIATLEMQANEYKKDALSDSLDAGKDLEAYVLEKTEDDYTRLSERFRHDPIKRIEFAEDWRNYAEAINRITSSGDMFAVDGFCVDGDDDELKRYREAINEPNIIREEIEKRFQKALGEKFSDRWDEASRKYFPENFSDEE